MDPETAQMCLGIAEQLREASVGPITKIVAFDSSCIQFLNVRFLIIINLRSVTLFHSIPV